MQIPWQEIEYRIQACPPIHFNTIRRILQVNPTVATTYNVTLMDAKGCSSTASKLVQVADVRCGNKLDKVQVCQVPKSNPENAHTI